MLAAAGRIEIEPVYILHPDSLFNKKEDKMRQIGGEVSDFVLKFLKDFIFYFCNFFANLSFF